MNEQLVEADVAHGTHHGDDNGRNHVLLCKQEQAYKSVHDVGPQAQNTVSSERPGKPRLGRIEPAEPQHRLCEPPRDGDGGTQGGAEQDRDLEPHAYELVAFRAKRLGAQSIERAAWTMRRENELAKHTHSRHAPTPIHTNEEVTSIQTCETTEMSDVS